MTLRKVGRIDSLGPKIFLGSGTDDLASVCLTAPDKGKDFNGQTRDILAVIDKHMAELGVGRDRLLTVQVWLADIGDYSAFVGIWNAWVGEDVPGLSVVEMAASRRDSLLEIRAWSAPG
ncbi:Rid family hydrolase [Mesorhizobium sp. SB112]|uniref:Rid family hydrolase n=1 Tax=Mesorhizobium sp. SB112 TaxID=3151853 RepID=UPI003263DB22